MNALVLPNNIQITNMNMEVETHSPEEITKGTKRKISLSNCAVCGRDEAKYTCPRCLTHSCSLLCVKKHKDDTGCSGVRDKTAFVTLSQFDDMNLLSDYRFLEDTGRFSDGATRDPFIRAPHVTMKAKCFMSNARKMNINLRLLPSSFTRSKENSTFFNYKEKRFMWHLKLIFPQSSAEFTQRRVSDQLTLLEILNPYIHPTESDPVARQKLKMYVHEPLQDKKIFMKAEGRKANSVRYHELDFHKSLKENLSYKTFIEFPVLHIVLKTHWKDYPLKGPVENSANANNTLERLNLPKEEKQSTKTSSEISSPQAKRPKREEVAEEKEEGELSQSSDEDDSSSSEESSDSDAKSGNVTVDVSKEVEKEKPLDDKVNSSQDTDSSEKNSNDNNSIMGPDQSELTNHETCITGHTPDADSSEKSSNDNYSIMGPDQSELTNHETCITGHTQDAPHDS